jgi:aspartyl-tRNA(Asn)/glutamyl-tRNA(Gln) amidotransferase subunit A
VDLGVPRQPDDRLVVTGVARIVRGVASGAVPASSVAAEHLERAASSTLNAFTRVDPERALARAGAVDRAIAAGESPGPLAGVPVALKDLIDEAGLPTTAGSSFYRRVADAPATVVERLEAAGAVIVGRAGLHEFAFGFTSENPWWGPVRNPWDPATSPGGSSGGSAAAVAAGLAVLGIGTDTGGSIRVPAALCGLVGLKPTHGRVPLSGVFPLAESLDTIGPITRTVADAAAVYPVLAGFDPADPWSAPREVRSPAGPGDLPGLRVGVPHPWVDRPLDEVTREGFGFALEALASRRVIVEPVEAPLLVPPGRAADLLGAEAAAVHRRWFAERPGDYGVDVAARLSKAVAVTTDDLVGARRWQAGLRHAAAALFERFDVLATPTVAVHRKLIGHDDAETERGPEPARRALSWFTTLVNHLGVPAMALPLAAPGSPPPSLQIVGPAWSEHRLLEVALALEAAGIVAPARAPGAPE